ncbi:AAA family ATPase [Amaricoccus tamworthensis]|uniref:AAA family ATPase n=1 Tax=Amaricoccus tamworthensis TaxID=57002 RepID=UPI003C7D9336
MTPGNFATLHMLCGKIAAGKSTLAARLLEEPGTVLIAEDEWLHALYGDEMATPRDFVRCSGRLRQVMGPHVAGLLRAGMSVVLDFQANTVDARRWMHGVAEAAGVDHRLHYLDVPDEVCLARLKARNAQGDHPFAATEEQFVQITKYFVPPSPEEGLTLVVHRADEAGQVR